VLGFARCGSRECPKIATTTDAGASFQSLPAPGGRFKLVPAASGIAFANSRDGWVFGPRLYATHDGGRHWKAISIPGTVTQLEPGSDEVFAVVQPPEPACYKTGSCTRRTTPKAPLWRVAPASDAWRRDPATVAHGASVGLGVHGRSIWVIDTETSRDGLAVGSGLQHSADDGAHFALEPGRRFGIPGFYFPVSNKIVWVYTSGGHFMFAQRSTDAGAHFRPVGPLSYSKTTPNNYPNGSSLKPASSRTAVAASDLPGHSLIRTLDAGATWRVVHAPLDRRGFWGVIGFTTPNVGYALWTDPGPPAAKNSTQLWRTKNAGATWSPVTALR
jgi:hypothetical protein